MLSKLLSNISAGNMTSAEEEGNGSGSKKGVSSSDQVFKSLLKSLKNHGSSGKAKQQLLALAGESSKQKETAEGDKASQSILGGSFTEMDKKKIQNFKQINKGILRELQEEFQNMKSELLGKKAKESTKGDQKGNEAQLTEEVSPKSAEGDKETGSDKNVDAVPGEREKNEESRIGGGEQKESDSVENPLAQSAPERVGTISQGQGEANKESENGNPEKESAQEKENITHKKNLNKQNAEKLIDPKNTKAGADKKNVNAGDKQAAESVTNTDGKSDKERGAFSQQKKSGSLDMQPSSERETVASDQKVAGQEDSDEKLQNEQVVPKGEPGNTTSKQGIEKRLQPLNSESKSFEKHQRIVSRQAQSDGMKQPKEGQKVARNTNLSSGDSQTSPSLQAGQTAKTELTEQQKKMMGSPFQKKGAAHMSTKGLEMKAVQSHKGKKGGKEKSEGESSLRGFGKESSEGRNKLLSRLGITGSNAQKQAKPLNFQSFSGISVGETNTSLSEQKANWEEQVTKAMNSSSDKDAKASSGSSSMRLGQIPVTNVSLRKKILPGLTQRIQKAAPSAKENAGSWQKHTFTLDDGKNIQLSVRESKGVLQVKMGSMNLDLSKLLQQNLQQIREHLRQEFGTEIDLQFENQQQGEESQLAEDGGSSNQKRNYRNNFAGKSLAAENAEDVRAKTVRNFGYNKVEWTA